MEIEFILYVADQNRSREFYSILLDKNPSLDVPGMTEFFLDKDNKVKLGLMPESGINKILSGKTPDPSRGNGIPRCEIYLLSYFTSNLFDNALKAGAKVISEPLPRDWGDKVAYVSDPDGHIIAIAEKL